MISEHRPGHFDEQAFRAEMQRLEKMEIPVLENELMWISRVVDEEMKSGQRDKQD